MNRREIDLIMSQDLPRAQDVHNAVKATVSAWLESEYGAGHDNPMPAFAVHLRDRGIEVNFASGHYKYVGHGLDITDAFADLIDKVWYDIDQNSAAA